LIDTEIIGVQEIFKSVSLSLETKADTVFHLCECLCQHGRRDCSNFIGNGNEANHTGRHQINVLKYTVLPSFVFISKLLHNLQFINMGPPMSESAVV
jgi:hypothetical protein